MSNILVGTISLVERGRLMLSVNKVDGKEKSEIVWRFPEGMSRLVVQTWNAIHTYQCSFQALPCI